MELQRISLETLISRYNEGKDLAGFDLSYMDLSNQNLTAAKFSRWDKEHQNLLISNLEGCNLQGTNLDSAQMIGVDLGNALLREANLKDANLNSANLREANLTETNLSCAEFTGANLSNANLRDANLQNADFRQAKLSHANLIRANLEDALLQEANLQAANLQLANLKNASFQSETAFISTSKSTLRGASFQNANLQNAKMNGLYLENVDFTGCNLRYVDFRESILQKCNFTLANLTGLKVYDTKYNNLITRNVSCEWVDVGPEGNGETGFRIELGDWLRESQIIPSFRFSVSHELCPKDVEFLGKLWHVAQEEPTKNKLLLKYLASTRSYSRISFEATDEQDALRIGFLMLYLFKKTSRFPVEFLGPSLQPLLNDAVLSVLNELQKESVQLRSLENHLQQVLFVFKQYTVELSCQSQSCVAFIKPHQQGKLAKKSSPKLNLMTIPEYIEFKWRELLSNYTYNPNALTLSELEEFLSNIQNKEWTEKEKTLKYFKSKLTLMLEKMVKIVGNRVKQEIVIEEVLKKTPDELEWGEWEIKIVDLVKRIGDAWNTHL